MTQEIEIQDELSLDDLIKEPAKVVIKSGEKKKTFWLRPPTEIEKALAEGAGRAKSAALRKRLRDRNSEEFQLLIQSDLDAYEEEELRMLWVSTHLFRRAFELSRHSLEDRENYYVPEPEGKDDGVIPPSTEEMDVWEIEKQAAEKERLETLRSNQEAVRVELEEKVKELSVEELQDQIIPRLVEGYCGREWNAEYGLQLVARCTYLDRDMTKQAFATVGRVRSLHERVQEALTQGHLNLMEDPDQVKN